MTGSRQVTATAARTADVSYGYYRIVAARRGARGQAVAYAGTLKICDVAADTEDEAVQALKAQLDARTAAFQIQRDDEGWPCAAEYREAISAIPHEQAAPMLRLLQAHGRRPNACATVNELGRIVGLDPADVLKHYSRLGRKLNAHLRLSRTRRKSDGQRYVVDSFASVSAIPNTDQMAIQLRPEVVEAVR